MLVYAALFLTGVSVSFAVPSIHWNSLPNRQQNGFSNWYVGPQAVGTNCVVVKVDVAAGPTGSFSAFSWIGSGGGDATVYSNANYALAPASQGIQIFRAVAEDSLGNQSPAIYWLVKTFATGTGSNPLTNSRGHTYTIGYGDLPIKGSGAILYPNLDDEGRNAALLADVILSLADNSSSGKVIEFDPVTYNFDLGSAGQTWGFDGVANLTLQSSSAGQATLKWHAGIGYDPHSLFSFPADSSNITVENLTFDTSYSTRYNDGTHIKIFGHNITVDDCHLYHATGYAISIGSSFVGTIATAPHDVHLDANTIQNTFADGIHVQQGNSIYLVGNVINGTGDDAIAVINDGYFDNASAGYLSMCTDVHILSNYVVYSGWRGIVLQSAIDSEVDGNEIDTTAQHGLEISRLGAIDGNSSYALPGNYPRRIAITNNSIWHAGWTPAHPNQSLGDSGKYYHGAHGIYLYYFNNPVTGETVPLINGSGNSVRYHGGDCVKIVQSANLKIGNSAWISDAGEPLTLGGSQQFVDSWYYGIPYNPSSGWDLSY